MSDREIMNAKQGKNHEVVKPKPKEVAMWIRQTMDIYADEMYSECGYDTCKYDEKQNIIEQMYKDGMFNDLNM